MAKSKSAKRKRNAQSDHPQKLPKLSQTVTPLTPIITPPDPPDTTGAAEPKSLQTLISDEELETTIDTLNLLSDYPNIIKSKACKDLRAAVYNFRQSCTTGVNAAHGNGVETNLIGRVSAALADGKYLEARLLLAEMRVRGELPKLGALCRWVRDLDVVSGLSMRGGPEDAVPERSLRDKELLLVLDAILRVTGLLDVSTGGSMASAGPVALRELWDVVKALPKRSNVCDALSDRKIFEFLPKDVEEGFTVIEHTPGRLRKPPNRHPALLHASKDNTIPICDPTCIKPIINNHPVIPNLSLILDVLSPTECKSTVAAAEHVGFTPDTPLLEGGKEDSSVLAHNFFWLVDEGFCGTLWDRVRTCVPAQVGGRKVRGLNRRFRMYRYVPGAEYRCHIDGAWPPSGIDPETKKYVYDSSPPEGRQSSLFTFLIYLNDDFEGGETTFFLPSVREGVMNAYPVRPVMGAVAMFPHGDAGGALLHEGTGVRKGVKYIIRTDVLYDIDATV